MPHYDYLIVGGGMTADAAVRGIRELDPSGSIGVVSDDPDPPYDRPPLTKGLWKGMEEEKIWRGTAELGAHLHLGRRIVRLDAEERRGTDDHGSDYSYERLLLATGGRPRKLDDAVPQVIYFRTWRDYRKLRDLAGKKRRFAVAGGSFIGSEIAAALASEGKQVALLFPEEGIARTVFPESVSLYLNDYYRERGVDVRPGTTVGAVRRSGEHLLVVAENGDEAPTLKVDGVVAGLGIQPNVALGEAARLEIESGIMVDAHLRTRDPHIWAAGDVASIWCPPLGRRMRVEHEDQANSSGRHAGRCMAGSDEEYDHIPFFYSDLFDLGYEAVGELDPSLDVVEDWAEPHRKGVLYYMREGRIRGVLLWDVWGRLDEARALIRSEVRRSAGDVRGSIAMD